jgi:hypothetical protein
MDLKEFVCETLSQLVDDVMEAQARTKDKKAMINPRLIADSTTGKIGLFHTNSGTGAPAQMVSFDVALTAMEGTGTKGGIGVVAGILTLGSIGQSKEESSSISRVKFSVPVSLPEYLD